LRRPFTTNDGQLITLEAFARGDVYHLEDSKFSAPGAPDNSQTIGRALGYGMVEWRWPFVSETKFSDTTLVVEPIAQMIVASGGGNPSGLPNEDSTTFDSTSPICSAQPRTGTRFVDGRSAFQCRRSRDGAPAQWLRRSYLRPAVPLDHRIPHCRRACA
jgi:lipopolysaccharide assembly outer membrane protein LptD (OstA)